MELKGDIKWYKNHLERLLGEIESLNNEEQVNKWLKDFNLSSSNLHNTVIRGKKDLKSN